MRQTASRLNRSWLTVLGLLLLLAGLAVVLIGTGSLRPLAAAVGLRLSGPAAADLLFGAATSTALGLSWVVLLLAFVGLVLAVLAVLWLLVQIPRTNEAKAFRLHDSAADGLTRCSPDVLTDAVERQLKALPDVQSASAVLRGTAQQPDLTVRVTAHERADLPQLLNTISTRVANDVGEALDTRLRRLGVQVEIGVSKNNTHQIVVGSPSSKPVVS
ncbi:MAG: alkaline shock response membrane anchor protein AmaP [Propionibacteriaceae bacterium]